VSATSSECLGWGCRRNGSIGRITSLCNAELEEVFAALGYERGAEGAGALYTVVQGRSGPRWLIPDKSRAARTILRGWRPYGLATGFLWRGLRLAARCGVLPLAPRTEQVRLPGDAGTRLLSRFGIEGAAPAPVIMVGNTVATRKLIVFVGIPGRGIAVIKWPLTDVARTSIGVEAETLKRLKGEHGAPHLLGYSFDSGAALQEYLSGRLGSRRLKPAYLNRLIDFARRGGETVRLRDRAQALGERLRGQADSGEPEAAIAQALALLEDDTPLPAALVHGDFAPWNIRDLENGGCALIDWESAQWAGLPLHDLCHFFCMQAKLFAPHTLFSDALERDGSWRRYCAALEIEHRFFRPLAAAFLLESLARARQWGPEESAAYYLEQLKRFLQARQ
jgi:hypothetical protein